MSKPSDKSKAPDVYTKARNKNRIPSFRCRDTDMGGLDILKTMIRDDASLRELIFECDDIQRDRERRGARKATATDNELPTGELLRLLLRLGLNTALSNFSPYGYPLSKEVSDQERATLRSLLLNHWNLRRPFIIDLLNDFTSSSEHNINTYLDGQLAKLFLISPTSNTDDESRLSFYKSYNAFMHDFEKFIPDDLRMDIEIIDTPDDNS